MLNLVETYENLVAVPSYHYQPVFAQAVRAAMEKFRPDAVAVELADALKSEMDWLTSCWPAPVATITEHEILPCVPGDSILEAYRLATARKIPTFCVDLDCCGEIKRSGVSLPSAEFAPRVGRLFLETTDALMEQAGPVAEGDVAREAYMAARLVELMAKHRCVLWVGGMAHWTRIVERLKNRDFTGPPVNIVPSHVIRRVRLAPTALFKMTGRIPFLLARYAKAPDRYDEAAALRSLGLAACRSKATVSLQIEGRKADAEDELPETPVASVDVAKMLLYARNLAAYSNVREVPGLGELLTASSATMGNRYAGRLYQIAMHEHLTAKSRDLAPLTYEGDGKVQGYRLDGKWIKAEPYWKPPGDTGMTWVVQQDDADKKMREPYANIPAAKEDEKRAWMAYPTDEIAYEAFVRYVLEHASLPDSQESKSFPFQTGLRDGVDVRDTIRHWKDGEVYVREQANAQLRVTNAIIDFTSRTERSFVLQGKAKGVDHAGWLDPSFDHVGSCSREATELKVLQEQPCHVSNRLRDLSMVSLDCPNSLKDRSKKTFYDYVILPLVHIAEQAKNNDTVAEGRFNGGNVRLVERTGGDNLYGWLDVMFRFCKRKTVVYYSAYVPSQRIHRVARKHHVRLIHIPLSRIPKPLLLRNRTFRFMHLTRTQWDELRRAVSDQQNAWVPSP